jgi:pentatricopeptide repeat protein
MEELLDAEDPFTKQWKMDAKKEAVEEAYDEIQTRTQDSEKQKKVNAYKEYLKKEKQWAKKAEELNLSLSPLRFLRIFAKQKNYDAIIQTYKETQIAKQQLDIDCWNAVLEAYCKFNKVKDALNVFRLIRSNGLFPTKELFLSLHELMIKNGMIVEAKQLYDEQKSNLESPLTSNQSQTNVQI